MKKLLACAALLAATIGTAAAQRPHTAGSNTGGNTSSGNANNTVSSGNASNTSSSAVNNNPTTSNPNYKPAAKPRGTGKDTQSARRSWCHQSSGAIGWPGPQQHSRPQRQNAHWRLRPQIQARKNKFAALKLKAAQKAPHLAFKAE